MWRCDVILGRHTGGMVLNEEFQGPSFVKCLQGSINTACCLIQINIKFLYGYIIQSEYTLYMYTDLSYRSSTLSSLLAP